jgi:tape measure domain-containing protein
MAAQDAELKLKVSLDLGFFRQQLAGLGQAAAGYSIPVQVKFDRRSVQNELNALGTNIRRRNYRLNIETNLSAEIAKVDTLARKLNELSGKIRASSGGAFSGGPQGAAGLEKFMREQGLTGKAFGVQQAQENIAKQAILARLQKGSLSKGGYNTAGLEKIIRDLGGTPSGGRKDLVAQAKRLVEESNGIADAVFDSLKDLQMRLRPIRGQAKTSAARSMPNLNEMLDRIANLTENPRAAQRMLRMMPESRLTTDLVGAANRQAAFKEQFPQGFRLPGFNGPKAFDPLLKSIAESFSDYTRTVNASNPWVGKIGSGITQLISRALTQSPEQMFGGRAPVGGQNLLPAAGQTSASRMTRQMFAGLPALQAPGIGGENAPLSRAASYMLNKANRTLGLPIGPFSPIGSMGQFPMSGMMGRGSMGQFPMSGMLGRGSMGQFPMSGMHYPSSPLGQITAQSSMFGGGGAVPPGGGGGGGGGGMGGFGRAMGGINLPGAGVIRELGSEFAFATKQVLLFGQAYKMLAFIQNFPAEVGAAVSQLQNFRNTLGAISPTAEEAAASNQLILDLVDKYNVPLQSARDGFTKLYASMAPAGFSGDEIRDLFTGITQAAATFGMSADKVDRVNYAFAQMASKGQVMSEELKGQLGDVLPGAMALFAEAAGFEGPKAIQDFSAALEDGAYKGQAMVALLKNVGVVMKQEFGPGAEGAARTFQGVINRMQNSMALLYESFEPVAVGFLNGVVVPLTSGIKQISDGFNAFFTGATAQTSGGFAIAQELERLRPAFEGIGANISGLIQQFGQFAGIALEVSKVLLQIAGNPIVGYLARLYAIALPINIALNVMRGLWAANAVQLLIFNARVATGTSTLSAFRGMMAATGATAQTTAASIRTAGITLRTFFATTGVGLVIVGISMLIEKFMSMNQALADTKAKALGAADAIRSMSQTEARVAEQSAQSAYKTIGAIAGRAGTKVQGPGNDRIIEISERELKQLQGVGAFQTAKDPFTGRITARRSDILSLAPQAQRLQAQAAGQIRDLRFQEQQTQQQAALAPIPPSEGDGKPKRERQLRDFNSEAIAQLRDNQRIAEEKLKQQRQLEIIDETEYEIASAANKRKFELLIIDEALAQKKADIGEFQVGVREKQLAVFEQLAANERKLVEEEEKTAVQGAKIKLERPFKDAIRDENIEIQKQGMLLENLNKGYEGLTAEQEANLIIEDKTRELKAKQQKLIETEIENLRKVTLERIKAARALQIEQTIKGLRDQLALLRAVSEEEQKRLRIAQENKDATAEQLNKIYDLEKVRDNIKAVRETIDSFVTETSSDYKGFLKEVISGEDAVESLKKFQQGLKDRVLTIFLDFAMAPVEKFFKEGLSKFAIENFFPKGAAENMPEGTKPSTTPIEAQDKNTTATDKNTAALEANTASRNGAGGAAPSPGQTTAAGTSGGFLTGTAALQVLPFNGQTGGMYSTLPFNGDSGFLSSLGINSEEMAASMAESTSAFSEQLGKVDTSVFESATALGEAGKEMGPNGTAGSTWQKSLGNVVGGIGIAAGSIMGIMAGIQQINEGGTSNVLGGIGSILLSVGGAIGGFAGMFKGGGGGTIPVAQFAANGAVWKGGFQAFANGGMVSGPTLGLVGEGKYNEAIVPLPDGRSIPVQFNGGRSAREMMNNGGPGSSAAPSLNMTFETTSINGVEYVSRDQLENAMASTRASAISRGARQGMEMTLEKLRNSPTTRSSIGMR